MVEIFLDNDYNSGSDNTDRTKTGMSGGGDKITG